MKLGKAFRIYAVVTQYLLLIFTLLVIGLYLGSKLDDLLGTDIWAAILGFIGIVSGITSFIYQMIRRGDGFGK